MSELWLREALEELEACIPDDIEAWRLMRSAGRSDRTKAMAVVEAFKPVAAFIAMAKGSHLNSDNMPSR